MGIKTKFPLKLKTDITMLIFTGYEGYPAATSVVPKVLLIAAMPKLAIKRENAPMLGEYSTKNKVSIISL